MYQTAIDISHIEKTPLAVPGCFIQVLHNEANGGMTVLTHMEPGATIPEHWHTHADETVYVLAGDFIEAGTSYGHGAFFAGSAGTRHDPHSSVNGCTVLTRFSAELDFQLVE